jgi:tetratricopeptide (TPR) repeat protein
MSETPSPLDVFLAELKRRKVYRVAAAYAAVGFVLWQAAEIAVPALGLPERVLTFVVVGTLVGFPVAVLLAWFFEVRREEPSPGVAAADLLADRTLRRRLVILIGAGAAVVVVTAAVVMLARPGGVTAAILQEGDRIVVADFQSHTGDTLLAATVGAAFHIDLSQSRYFAPVTDPEIANALRRMEREPGESLTPELAREIAIRDGYPATFEGQVDAAGSGWIFSVQLVAPITGQVLISERETVPDEDAVLAAVDLLSARVRERIGESLQSIEASAPLPEVTTSSLGALQAYALGWQSFRGGGVSLALSPGGGDVTELHLKQAIALDSTFAMAPRLLGGVYRNSGRWAPMIEHTTRAYELRDGLPPRERLGLIAAYHERVSGDLDAAATALTTLQDEFPGSGPFVPGLLSAVHMRNHRYAAAESVLVRIQQSESGLGSSARFNMVSVKLSLGKIDEALAIAEEAAATGNAGPKARSYFVLGRWDDASAVMEEWAGSAPSPGRQAALADHGSLIALVQGRYGEFERLQEESVESGDFGREAEAAGQRRVAAAHLSVLRDTALARQTADRALQDFEDVIDGSPEDQAWLAEFYAAAGDRDRSRDFVRQFEESGQPFIAGGHAPPPRRPGRRGHSKSAADGDGPGGGLRLRPLRRDRPGRGIRPRRRSGLRHRAIRGGSGGPQDLRPVPRDHRASSASHARAPRSALRGAGRHDEGGRAPPGLCRLVAGRRS